MRRLAAHLLVAAAVAAALAVATVPKPAAAATPVAAIAPATPSVQAGVALELRADGLEQGAVAAWSFGDGTSSTGATVSHAWAAAGTYAVTLTVTGPDGSVATASTTVTVTAAPAPSAAFAWTPTAPRVGVAVRFAVLSPVAGATYAWDFGDGTTGSGAEAEHAFARPGAVVVTLTATAAGASAASLSATVVVQLPPPTRPIAVSSSKRARPNERILFATTFTDGPALWIFGDGTRAAGARVWHAFRRPGTYHVILAVTDAYGRRSSTRLTIVVAAPAPDATAPVRVPAADDLPTLHGPSARSRKDPLYSAAAARLAGGPRAVLCWSEAHWAVLSRRTSQRPGERLLGFVDLREPRRINLSPSVCRTLDEHTPRRGRGGPVDVESLAQAIGVLVHETVHTLGVRNEAETECYAMQRLEEVARPLGAGDALVAELVLALWRGYAKETMADGYWSPECRDGGALDLDPDDRSFP